MAKFEVKNSEGKKVAEAELAAEVYGIEPNIHVMHHIVKCQMASWRQGTQSAKGRSEVSGGGKKPWRQKGTGRARQGSIRAAQWRHGGVVFAPKPRSYAKRMNNKEVKLAMRSALSAKLADGELVLVDDYGFEKPSTKAAVAMLKALGLEGKRLTIIVRDEDVNAYLSFRNIPKTFIITADEANTYDLVNNNAVLMHILPSANLRSPWTNPSLPSSSVCTWTSFGSSSGFSTRMEGNSFFTVSIK